MIDESWAHASNVLIYSAMVVYAAALAAFATDLSTRGVGARAETRELVAAGGGGVTTTVRTPAAVTTRSKPGNVAVIFTWLAFVLHAGGVLARGISAHRVPWGNMYEFSTSGAVVVTGVFLIVLTRRDVRYLGAFVVGPVLLTLGLAVTVLYTASAQLVPALHSFWLVIHVSVAFIATALFTLAFSTTILQLVQERRENRLEGAALPERVGWRRLVPQGDFMAALPSSVDLERAAYRLHVVAFPLWSFTLIAGAIWAEASWGRYWGWDPKEVWTFVIWVVYAGYLHARATRGWDGRRAAYVALFGYACILFNFLVVNVFFVGFHSYGGVGGGG